MHSHCDFHFEGSGHVGYTELSIHPQERQQEQEELQTLHREHTLCAGRLQERQKELERLEEQLRQTLRLEQRQHGRESDKRPQYNWASLVLRLADFGIEVDEDTRVRIAGHDPDTLIGVVNDLHKVPCISTACVFYDGRVHTLLSYLLLSFSFSAPAKRNGCTPATNGDKRGGAAAPRARSSKAGTLLYSPSSGCSLLCALIDLKH